MKLFSLLSGAAALAVASAWSFQPIDHEFPIYYNYPDVNCLDHLAITFNATLSGGRTVFNANLTITGFALAPNNNSLLVDGYLFYRAYVGGPLIRQTFTDIPANLTGDFSPWVETRRLAEGSAENVLGNTQDFTKPQDAKGPSSASLFPDITLYNEAKAAFAKRDRELSLITTEFPVCPVLYLDLGPIPLDLLGVDVDPAPLEIDCGQLVGTCSTIHDLLCAIARLLYCRREEGPTFPVSVPL